MITISLCMIVKDEEDVLARCLESAADAADEIIIVDTGSADATKEIARRYTDKVYDFAWTGRLFRRAEFFLLQSGDGILHVARRGTTFLRMPTAPRCSTSNAPSIPPPTSSCSATTRRSTRTASPPSPTTANGSSATALNSAGRGRCTRRSPPRASSFTGTPPSPTASCAPPTLRATCASMKNSSPSKGSSRRATSSTTRASSTTTALRRRRPRV